MHFELATSEAAATEPGARLLVWPAAGGNSSTVQASIDPWLTALGRATAPAIDLVRIATAALIADRRTARPADWERELQLVVHAVEPARWADGVGTVAELLRFLTGDTWEITLVSDQTPPPDAEEPPEVEAAAEVALFSGGLDSFCHAVLSEAADQHGVYVSQRDNPVIAASQNRATAWLKANMRPDFEAATITLAQAEPITEKTSRTRSLLFMALGLAVAEARGAAALTVPENGFTSLNPPLRIDRAGALSTRSTHPHTFALVDRLGGEVGLGAGLANPYGWLTKGELVGRAAEANPAVGPGVARTLSCAKLDGRVYKGGDPNLNCGLCVACVVRRAAIVASGLDDTTPYIVDRVKAAVRAQLIERRRPEISAVQWALLVGADEDALIANASFPPDFDIDRAVELWDRTLDEIGRVELP